MGFPPVGDDNQKIIDRLEAIYEAVSEQEYGDVSIDESVGETTVNEMYNVDEGDVDMGLSPGGYFTTGPGGIALEAAGLEEYKEVEIGFEANVINIRSDTPLLIALADPRTNPGRWSPIRERNLPFTLGGDTPIDADGFWITQLNADAEEPAVVDIFAY